MASITDCTSGETVHLHVGTLGEMGERFTRAWNRATRGERELALALGRDHKNVHADVAVLEAAGLLVREGRRLSAPWDELQASVSLIDA